jgi:tetratricopeptide (TPR) repeat protein
MNNLALCYSNEGRYQEAEMLYKECFEKQILILGKDNPCTLLTMTNLANIYGEQGNFNEAEILNEECLKKQKNETIIRVTHVRATQLATTQ